MRANIEGLDGEWARVSGSDPCPICGAGSDCRKHTEGTFVSCSREPSDWRLENGGWLHKLEARSRPSEIRLKEVVGVRAGSARSSGVAS
jgi:hypothetical protein